LRFWEVLLYFFKVETVAAVPSSSVSERAILSLVLEISVELLVSLLDVDADTDGHEQKSASDDQDDNQRITLGFIFLLVGLGRRDRVDGVVWLVDDLGVISVEADHFVGIVQHDVVAAEQGIADQVSLVLEGSVLAVDKELACIISLRLVVDVRVGNLLVDGIVTLLH
jgi:hypothetical protein